MSKGNDNDKCGALPFDFAQVQDGGILGGFEKRSAEERAVGQGLPVEFALAHRRSEDTGYGISDGEYGRVEGDPPGVEGEDGEIGGRFPGASAVDTDGTGECAYARPDQSGLLRDGYASGADGA